MKNKSCKIHLSLWGISKIQFNCNKVFEKVNHIGIMINMEKYKLGYQLSFPSHSSFLHPFTHSFSINHVFSTVVDNHPIRMNEHITVNSGLKKFLNMFLKCSLGPKASESHVVLVRNAHVKSHPILTESKFP